MKASERDSASGERFLHYLAGGWCDRLLLVLLLVAIAFGWLHIRSIAGNSAPLAAIYHGRTLIAEYPLDGTTMVHVPVQGDIGVSDIVIGGGEVFVSRAPCRGQQCVRSGHRHRIGDAIVCVPNRILVAIRGGAKAYDAVVE